MPLRSSLPHQFCCLCRQPGHCSVGKVSLPPKPPARWHPRRQSTHGSHNKHGPPPHYTPREVSAPVQSSAATRPTLDRISSDAHRQDATSTQPREPPTPPNTARGSRGPPFTQNYERDTIRPADFSRDRAPSPRERLTNATRPARKTWHHQTLEARQTTPTPLNT